MTTQGELPDIVERLRDVERRAIEFSQGWGAGGAHGKMMAAFAITEIERLRATPPGSPLERKGVKPLPGELALIQIAMETLRHIASYSPVSRIQPVLIARDALKKINALTFESEPVKVLAHPSPSPTEREGE